MEINSKSEARNSKYYRNPKISKRITIFAFLRKRFKLSQFFTFENSNFGFVSYFEIQVSNLIRRIEYDNIKQHTVCGS